METAGVMASFGFECVGSCAAACLVAREDVRQACNPQTCCKGYGKSWTCPPEAPELAIFQEKFTTHTTCWVVQTVMELEDDFDFETMMEALERHNQRIISAADYLAQSDSPALRESLVLGAGCCPRCASCTYPDAPCRFPGRQISSMEAAGLLVSDVCQAAGIPYNHGPRTIAYVGCILL